MKRVGWLGALLATLGIFGLFQPNVAAQKVNGAAAAPGEFIIKFAGGATEAQQEQAVRARGGQVTERIRELGIATARFAVPKGAEQVRSEALVKALESDIVIEYAEPNYVVTVVQEPVAPAPAATGDVGADQAGRRRWIPGVQGLPILLPDDPSTSEQWAWNIIGAYRGWGFGTGRPDVMIAIVELWASTQHIPIWPARSYRGTTSWKTTPFHKTARATARTLPARQPALPTTPSASPAHARTARSCRYAYWTTRASASCRT